MQGWHRAYPLSKAVEMVSKIDQTDRVHVLGEGFEVSGHPIEGTINATRGDVESYAQFQLAPLRDEEPITDEADRHAVRVNIFENADRSDLSHITGEVRPMDADLTDTIMEFPVRNFEVVDEPHSPGLLVNEDFDPAEVDDEERAERLARVHEMVQQDTPYYAVLDEIGAGKIHVIGRDDAMAELQEWGYVRETAAGKYELTEEGEYMHQAFSDYIYGNPG